MPCKTSLCSVRRICKSGNSIRSVSGRGRHCRVSHVAVKKDAHFPGPGFPAEQEAVVVAAAHLQKYLGLARRVEQRPAMAVGNDVVLAAVGDEYRGFPAERLRAGFVGGKAVRPRARSASGKARSGRPQAHPERRSERRLRRTTEPRTPRARAILPACPVLLASATPEMPYGSTINPLISWQLSIQYSPS